MNTQFHFWGVSLISDNKEKIYQTLLNPFSVPMFVYQLDWSLDGTSSLAGEWKIFLLKSALPTPGKGGHYNDFDAFSFKNSQ